MYSSRQIKKEELTLRAELISNTAAMLPVIVVAIVTNSIIIMSDVFNFSKAVLLGFLSWSIVRKEKSGTGTYGKVSQEKTLPH